MIKPNRCATEAWKLFQWRQKTLECGSRLQTKISRLMKWLAISTVRDVLINLQPKEIIYITEFTKCRHLIFIKYLELPWFVGTNFVIRNIFFCTPWNRLYSLYRICDHCFQVTSRSVLPDGRYFRACWGMSVSITRSTREFQCCLYSINNFEFIPYFLVPKMVTRTASSNRD